MKTKFNLYVESYIQQANKWEKHQNHVQDLHNYPCPASDMNPNKICKHGCRCPRIAVAPNMVQNNDILVRICTNIRTTPVLGRRPNSRKNLKKPKIEMGPIQLSIKKEKNLK